MKIIRVAILSLVGLLSSGCAARNHKHSPPPLQVVSLNEALRDAISALDDLYAEKTERERNHGLVPSEVEVVFQLAAGTKEGEEHKLAVGLPGITAGSGWTSEVTRSNANTITVRLRSIAFARIDELASSKGAAEKIVKLVEKLKKNKTAEPVF